MSSADQGFSTYYDATAEDSFATVGMGDLSSWLGAGGSKYAVVSTTDPAPDGDLRIRTGPGTSYPQVNGNGGAEKDGIVTVLDVSDDGEWVKVAWGGGLRRPAATGWAASRFLLETDTPPAFGPPPAPAPGPIVFNPTPGPVKPVVDKPEDEGSTTKTVLLIGAGVAVLAIGAVLLGGK